MDGKADGNLYGKTYEFHDVTIVFVSPTANVYAEMGAEVHIFIFFA